MSEKCIVCLKENHSQTIYCDECRLLTHASFHEMPQSWKDALWSVELSETAESVFGGYGFDNIEWGEIMDFIMLIAAGLKTKSDLKGFLIKNGAKPVKAKELVEELISMYFE